MCWKLEDLNLGLNCQFTSFILGKLLNLSEPQFSHLLNGTNIYFTVQGLLLMKGENLSQY